MVIDFHTHAFPDSIAPRAIESLVKSSSGVYPPCADGTVNGLIGAMDRFGVDISVIQPVVTKASQTHSLNQWASSVQSERIIAFGGIYPHSENYKEDIDYVCSLGLKGIKLHPEYQAFTVNDRKMMRIYDYALERGLILLFHAGYDPAYADCHSSPAMFAQVRAELGGGVIIAAHLGGQMQWDQVLEHICGSEVYIDTSMGFGYYGKERFTKILDAHGAGRILFGSDSPWSRAKEDIEELCSLPISDSDKQMILCSNAKRLLGID